MFAAHRDIDLAQRVRLVEYSTAPESSSRAGIQPVTFDEKKFQRIGREWRQVSAWRVLKHTRCLYRIGIGPDGLVTNGTSLIAARFHLCMNIGQMEKSACNRRGQPLIRLQRAKPYAG